MKKETLSALTNAHAWVGLVISTALFIVFLAGSFSLFRDNIAQWEMDPHLSLNTTEINVSADQVIQSVVTEYNLKETHYFRLFFPTTLKPYYQVSFEDHGENGEEVYRGLVVSAQTGEIVANDYNFTFADFLYRLHVDLKIPTIGKYLVGIVTLFFFVALISGVVIHWRKIAKNFFLYRKDKTKDKYLDGHNLIGVMGLPFHIMYAITGLIFNLVIVYQIAYALVLYGGDQTALLKDAGYNQPHIAEIGKHIEMRGFDDFYQRAKDTLDEEKLNFLAVEHFGDESAMVSFGASDSSAFGIRKEVIYRVSTGEQLYLTLDNYNNAVRSGLRFLQSLHFGDFAGYGLRIVFFILGIGTCYIILTGNLMWLAKREKNKRQSKRGLHVVRAITSGGFIGSMAGVATSFLAARILAPDMINRSEMVQNVFGVTLLICVVVAFFIKNFAVFNSTLLKLVSVTLLLTLIADWVLFSQQILMMISLAHYDVLIVEGIVALFALCCWGISLRIGKKSRAVEQLDPVTVSS